jgi:hypothetical protein
MGGGSASVEKRKELGSGWTLLEWGINHGFSITMHATGVSMRKSWCGAGHSETKSDHISISWWETIPWGGIEAKGRSGQVVSYTYSP